MCTTICASDLGAMIRYYVDSINLVLYLLVPRVLISVLKQKFHRKPGDEGKRNRKINFIATDLLSGPGSPTSFSKSACPGRTKICQGATQFLDLIRIIGVFQDQG